MGGWGQGGVVLQKGVAPGGGAYVGVAPVRGWGMGRASLRAGIMAGGGAWEKRRGLWGCGF